LCQAIDGALFEWLLNVGRKNSIV